MASLPVFFTAAMAVQLRAELGFGTVGIGAAVGVFFGTMAVSSLYLGRVADRLGATVSLRTASFGIAAAAFGIAALSRNWLSLTSGLVVAGLAAALAQPAANRLLINRVRGARLGTAFGLKQSAPPTASMLAGLAVPAISLTVGWRWAYVLAGIGALMVAVAVGPRPPNAPRKIRRAERVKPEALPHRATLVVLAVSFGLAFAASSVVLAFYVDSAVETGTSERQAGLVFAAASLTAVVTRLVAGAACDRYTFEPLRLSAVLLGSGAIGTALLAVGRPATVVLGAVVALGGTWGFPGVFWYALVRAYPATPGRITGTMAPAALGGVVGPIGFGAVATEVSYSVAWSLASAVALLAAAAMLVGARRLARTGAVG
ncbi:MAG: MFS transporter [Nitriliruptor sp.]|uniref:MFS transporter n=1 Tax=Nitriliruptor sp. TaxID=2448056 RepID=UPI0034A01E02